MFQRIGMNGEQIQIDNVSKSETHSQTEQNAEKIQEKNLGKILKKSKRKNGKIYNS